MKNVKRICTIQDCIQRLHYIFHNLYVTDLVMHKQGVVYELESYQKKWRKRLQVFFHKLKKVIKTTDKEEIIKIIQKKEDIYYKKVREEKDKVVEYSPERVTWVEISVTEIMLCGRIRDVLAEEDVAYKSLQEVLELQIYLTEKAHKEYREMLRDYGYIPRKEKKVKHLKIINDFFGFSIF